MAKQKVLLIGWDAADWQIINPLMDAGKMPALSRMVNEGVMGNISTLEPVISPILWTSIATGKTGDAHGILGFTETFGLQGGVRPSSSHSRHTKAIWNILQQNDYNCHQVGWWATHPAEPLNGTSVSNLYGEVKSKNGAPLPLHPEAVHPKEEHELFASFRIPAKDITGSMLSPLVPHIQKAITAKDERLAQMASDIAECTNYHAALTYILENKEWDFATVYLKAIDTACHRFMHYHPPKLPYITDEDFELYKDVVNGFYRYHDMMLDRLLQLAGEDTTVILVSDHGFHSQGRRTLANPKEPAGIAYDHRPFGVFCAKGPGIKKDEIVYGASLLDVTPTILAACGLPVGRDMQGKVLSSIFEQQPEIRFIDSWDQIEGNSGFIGNEPKANHQTSKEELKQLIDLGYIEDPGDNLEQAVSNAGKENKFNLARIYQHQQQHDKALQTLLELSEDFPDEHRFKIRMASLHQRMGQYTQSQQLINELRETAADIQKKIQDTPEGEKVKHYWKVSLPTLNVLEANNLLGEKKYRKALEKFEILEKNMPSNTRINLNKAKAYERLGEFKEAIKEYECCLEKDPDYTMAHLGLAHCYLSQEQFHLAVDEALEAIGGIYFLPQGHFILGQALYALQDYENAAQAFEVCLHQRPAHGKSRNRLIEIYKEHLNQKERAQELTHYFEKQQEDTIIIVSGIPRSGTSLMMQILDKAGLPLLIDGVRTADTSNPKGYYEYEPVKNLANESAWLDEAKGKVLKVVSQLLFQLPDRFNYKLIFMKRDLEEVIASQQKMIALSKNIPLSKTYPTHLEMAYKKNLERVNSWQQQKNNVECLYLEHSELLNNPEKPLSALRDFLGIDMDVNTLQKVIDKSLHRSKPMKQ